MTILRPLLQRFPGGAVSSHVGTEGFDVEAYLDWIGEDVPTDPSRALDIAPPSPESNDRYYAGWRTYRSQVGRAYLGSLGYINLWNTPDVIQGDHSIAQVAMIRGSETIEAGVYKGVPSVNQGRSTLFVFFTTNSHDEESDWIGGYIPAVAGFVPYSGTIQPNIAFDQFMSFSQAGGSQYIIKVYYALGHDGNWWLSVNDQWVGYFPRCHDWETEVPCSDPDATSLFNGGGIKNYVNRVDFYGEVFDLASAQAQAQGSPQPATRTDMGSGAFQFGGFGHAAYIRNMKVVRQPLNYANDANWQFFEDEPGQDTAFETDAFCYGIDFVFDGELGANGFYYGGPGKDALGCN